MWELVLGDTIFVIGVGIGLVAGAVAAIMLVRRRIAAAGIARADQLTSAVVAGGAVLVGTVSVALVAVAAWRATLPGLSLMQVPLAEPRTVRDVEALPHVTDATYTGIDLSSAGAPASAVWWSFAAEALPSIATLGACVLIVWLCAGLALGRPFARRLPVAIAVFAVVVFVTGIGGQVASGLARADLGSFLDAASGRHDFLGFAVAVDLAPLGWFFLLLMIAGAFRIGTRMQDDTRGLV